uniref:ATP synthase F0 subunit 6 n=1 Tax=Moniezia expansa TaxID=28841 RepID=A0A343A6Y8_MONEX|nr:ATP synthase F0 subunit 6 [Moniezia expansa]AOY40438.1 ATP synthase F0 subunit 6 [Moniezia expansa]
MFMLFSGYNCMLSLLYNSLTYMFSYYYAFLLSNILILFLLYRVPYCYSPYLFAIILIVIVFGLFLTLFVYRVVSFTDEFFNSFIPVGTPLYICLLVCLAESVSYIIRPIVLILRPFININLGCLGSIAICSLNFSYWLWIFCLLVLFLYEVFVDVVHWYIVVSILSFSIEH